jgi:hypothetical protein
MNGVRSCNLPAPQPPDICWRRAKDPGGLCNQATNKVPDAAKVPPSRFQKRKGSIYATPSSRDGHIDKNYAEKYYAKIAEMKAGKAGRSAAIEEASNKKQQINPITWGTGFSG